MTQPLHHSFILRPSPSSSTPHNETRKRKMTTATTTATIAMTTTRARTCSPLPPQVIPPPSLTLCQDKTLTGPPLWSRRCYPTPPTMIVRKFNYNCNMHEDSHSRLRQEFEPPTAPAYWKNRCQQFQQICHTSRTRIRDMQEDQRQLRRRIHKLEEQLTWNNNASPVSPPAISISRTSGTTSTSVPAMIVTETTKARDCFYLADCEGMSDSEYGQYYYNFEDEDDDDDTDDDE